MRNKILIVIILVLSYFAVQIKPSEVIEKKEETNQKENITVRVLNSKTEELATMDLEDYIVGVVAAEMPASFSLEALKAQAVASRTFALYKIKSSKNDYDVVTDVSDQAYITMDEMHEKWQNDFFQYYPKVREAVEETKNKILTFNGEVICAFYFAMSNGYTEETALVFGDTQDYLKSVESPWEKDLKNFEVTITLSQEEFCQKLDISCEKINISDIDYSKTGRVNSLKINNKTFKGAVVRSLLGLRSTDFSIDVSDDITITTRGYGHGVGMSQYGANEMAKLGKNYEEILNYYYQDVKLQEINA